MWKGIGSELNQSVGLLVESIQDIVACYGFGEFVCFGVDELDYTSCYFFVPFLSASFCYAGFGVAWRSGCECAAL